MRYGFLIKTAWHYVLRSYRSTMVLGLMVFAAVGCLVFLSALAVGTNDAMIRNSIGLFSGHIAGVNLPSGTTPESLMVDGTAGVLIRNEVVANIGQPGGTRTETVRMIGVAPLEEKKLTALWKKTLAGRYLEPGQPEIYLSRPLAQNLRVSVGDGLQIKLEAWPTATLFTVSGLYQTGVSQLDYGLAFCPMPVLPDTGAAVSAAIFLKEGIAAEAVIKIYQRRFDSGHFLPWREFMPDLKQLIDLNYVSMTIVMILVFGVVSLGIACAFVIFILKSMREFGILKAIGMFSSEIVMLIALQVIMLTLTASLAGTAAGAGAVAWLSGTGIDLSALTSHNPYFVVSGVIFPRLTPFSACLPAVAAILFGALAAIWPSIFVIRKSAADILRSI
jgi:ABC-type lipoprotein release transport system permease subunit